MSDALIFEVANSEFLYRESGAALPYNAAYTVMWWMRFDGNLEDGISFGVGTGLSAYDHIHTFGSGSSAKWNFEAAGGSGGSATALGDFIDQNVWIHCVFVRESATSLKLWTRREDEETYTLQGTVTADVSGRSAATQMRFGSFWELFYFEGALAYLRSWTSAALTESDWLLESESPTPLETADLWEDWPFVPGGDVLDGVVNGRDWTASGTLSSDVGPSSVSGGSPSIEPGLLTGGEVVYQPSLEPGITTLLFGDTSTVEEPVIDTAIDIPTFGGTSTVPQPTFIPPGTLMPERIESSETLFGVLVGPGLDPPEFGVLGQVFNPVVGELRGMPPYQACFIWRRIR